MGTGTGSWCVLVEYDKDNHYARFHDPSYHRCRESYFSILLDMKFWQSQWSVKCRSRVPGHGVCLKSMTRTITMQGFMILAIIGAEKVTLVFYLT